MTPLQQTLRAGLFEGLKLHIPNDEYDEIQLLTGLNQSDGIETTYIDIEKSRRYNGNYYSLKEDVERNYKFYGVKPILHDLSFLTKPIGIGGERFVPIECLKQLNGGDDLELTDYGLSVDNGYAHSYNLMAANEFIQQLNAWHFNLYGLKEGEYIPVHTLQTNPY